MTYIATLPQAKTPSLSNFDQRLGPIEYRRPGLLKPYANNPRKHPEKQIVKLVASIRQFGFVLPVLVDGQGTIIAGQARVEAASRLGQCGQAKRSGWFNKMGVRPTGRSQISNWRATL